MKIVINPFDKKSINDAIKQVKAYKKDFKKKEREFVRKLAEIGVRVAQTGYELADYDGEKGNIDVRLIGCSNKVAVVAKGKTVGFIEFGTGVRNPEWVDGGNVSGSSYTPPKHGTYGAGHGAQPYGWWFNPVSGGDAIHTYGNVPAEAMLTARDEMVDKVTQIAREVWR